MNPNDLKEFYESMKTSELEKIIYKINYEYTPEAITTIKEVLSQEPLAKVVIPVETGIQSIVSPIENTGFPLSWE